MRFAALSLSVMMLLALSVTAAEPEKPKQALSFSVSHDDQMISYMRLFGTNAVLLEAGYDRFTFEGSNNQGVHEKDTSQAWEAGIGFRHYLRQEQMQPFVQADYIHGEPTNVPCGGAKIDTGRVGGGLEYHVSRNFSVEGYAGLVRSATSGRCHSDTFESTTTAHQFGTFRSAISVNFYF